MAVTRICWFDLNNWRLYCCLANNTCRISWGYFVKYKSFQSRTLFWSVSLCFDFNNFFGDCSDAFNNNLRQIFCEESLSNESFFTFFHTRTRFRTFNLYIRYLKCYSDLMSNIYLNISSWMIHIFICWLVFLEFSKYCWKTNAKLTFYIITSLKIRS